MARTQALTEQTNGSIERTASSALRASTPATHVERYASGLQPVTVQIYTVEPIEVRYGQDRYRYYAVGDVFYKEWKRGLDSSKSSWPLRGTSPLFAEISGRPSEVDKTVRISMLLVACAVIVYFSEYHRSIPLLAPFLGLLGAWWFFNTRGQILPRCWTLVRKQSGEDAFYLVQPEKKSDAWVAFEAELTRAIEQANGAEA